MNADVQPKIFQDRGGFGKLGHLDKHLIKNQNKKLRREKFWNFFSYIPLKLHFEWKI